MFIPLLIRCRHRIAAYQIGHQFAEGDRRQGWGQNRSFGDVGSMSGLPESGHGYLDGRHGRAGFCEMQIHISNS
jgi:hypothetical protein